MQSLLEGLGVFFLFLIAILLLLFLGIVVFIILLIKSVSSSNLIYQQGKDYVDNTIRAIANQWIAQEIRIRATPKMLESEDLTQWQNYCTQCEINLIYKPVNL
jgi:hypothetical protein